MIQFNNVRLPETKSSNTGSANSSISQLGRDIETEFSNALAMTMEQFQSDPGKLKTSISSAAAAPGNPARPVVADTVTGAPVDAIVPEVDAPTNATALNASSAANANIPADTTTHSNTLPPATPAPGMPSYDPFLQAAFKNLPAPTASSTTSAPSPKIAGGPEAADSNPTPADSPTTSAGSTAPPSSSTPSPEAIQAFDDSYWAKQPAAVQALRTMQDQGQRTQLAMKLAAEGYKIDVPIMVWHWDPCLTTNLRESLGYTWVPSALQNPVEMAPGLPSLPGLPAYDPKNPPPGSIAV